MQFLAIFSLPNVGKCSFRCFSVFPSLGNVFFCVSVVSQTWERSFPPFSTFPNIGKTVFISRHRGLILDEWADEAAIITAKTITIVIKIDVVTVYNWRCTFYNLRTH